MFGAKRSAWDVGGAARPRSGGARKKRKASAVTPSRRAPPRRPVQRLLDFGQSSLGRTRECGACGLLYVPGDPRDEALHAARCDPVRRGVACDGWADERRLAAAGGARVVEVRGSDAAPRVAVVAAARAIVARDLGEPPASADGAGARSYLALAGGRVVGLCVVAPRPPGGAGGGSGAPGLGVVVLWVHASRRRSGIATLLVDAARASFHFSAVVSRAEIATTHLTAAGAAFFGAYSPGPRRIYAPEDDRPPGTPRPDLISP